MDWLSILCNVFIVLCLLISVLNLVYVFTVGKRQRQERNTRYEELIAYLDNCLLVLNSNNDDEMKNQMLLYLYEQWREAHPEKVKKGK